MAAAVDEKKALAWAINRFRERAGGPAGGPLTIEASKRFYNTVMPAGLMGSRERGRTPEEKNEAYAFYVKWALAGTPWATLSLCQFAATLIERGEQLPDVMRGFIAEYLRGNIKTNKRKPGPDSWLLKWRDSEIVGAIKRIAAHWKIPATRNRASKRRASAASIAQEALKTAANVHLSEAAINNIWNRAVAKSRESLARIKR